MRFDFCFFRGKVKARGAVDSVGIEQRHRGQVELSADGGQFLGQGRAFEKTESRAGVEFDVHQLQVESVAIGRIASKNIRIRDQMITTTATVFQSYVPSTNQPPPSKSCTRR